MNPATAPLLAASDLERHFVVRDRGLLRRRAGAVAAVDGVSLTINRGETLGVVGESGCGKSTLARLLLGLDQPTAGRVVFDGTDVSTLSAAGWKALRRRVQVVFQDPYASLNPRMTAAELIAEPLTIHEGGSTRDHLERVHELLELVGLPTSRARWYPHQFSGGQRQRIGIARALASRPDLIVCDEPVSALDVSVQAQIINLLRRLQRELGVSLLFISHDLSVVRHVSHRIAVMYLGRVIETGTTAQIFDDPQHPYTQALLSAVPVASVADLRGPQILLDGDLPSPLDPPSGCAFRTRCWRATETCAGQAPPLAQSSPNSAMVACYHPGPEPRPSD